MSKIVAIQEHLRPALQPVFGCKDYEDEKRLLERVDLILRRSGVERMFLELSQEQFDANPLIIPKKRMIKAGSLSLIP